MSRNVKRQVLSVLVAGLATGLAWGQVPTVNLSATERVGDAAAVDTALPGFTIKTVKGPLTYYDANLSYGPDLYWHGMDGDPGDQLEYWTTVPRSYIDFLGDANPSPVTVSAVNFTNDGAATQFPGIAAGGEQFGVRAEGFIVLAAGTYRIGLDATDEGYLWIGNQALAASWFDTTVTPPGTPQVFDLVVTAPGTYPIRVEVFHQSSTPPTDTPHAHLYQVVEGSNVDIGTGTMPVYQALASGTYSWRTHGVTRMTSERSRRVLRATTRAARCRRTAYALTATRTVT